MLPVDFLACRAVSVAGTADVGELLDQVHDVIAELALDLLECRGSVLDRVVQPGSRDHGFVGVFRRGDQLRDGFQMNLVGLQGVLSKLLDSGMGRSGETARLFHERFQKKPLHSCSGECVSKDLRFLTFEPLLRQVDDERRFFILQHVFSSGFAEVGAVFLLCFPQRI